MPTILVSIVMVLLSLWAGEFALRAQQYKQQRLALIQEGQALLATETPRFLKEFGRWPASFQEIASTPGFEPLRTYLPRSQGGYWYAPTSPIGLRVSNTFTNTEHTFQRAAIVGVHDSRTIDEVLSLRVSECSAIGQTFFNHSGWCDNALDASISLMDSRRFLFAQQAIAYKAQSETVRKLRYRFKGLGAVPSFGTPTELRNLVSGSPYISSYAGASALECYGAFHWQGAALECGDLYSTYGVPVSVRRISATQFELYSESVLQDATGAVTKISLTASL